MVYSGCLPERADSGRRLFLRFFRVAHLDLSKRLRNARYCHRVISGAQRFITLQFPPVFTSATVPAWYQRVACWCVRNRISLRTPNRTIPRNPLKVAREVYRCVLEIDQTRAELKNLLPCEVCNFDETAIQIFALWINISNAAISYLDFRTDFEPKRHRKAIFRQVTHGLLYSRHSKQYFVSRVFSLKTNR
jgi:hypothetical protein